MKQKKKQQIFKYTIAATLIMGVATATFLVPPPAVEQTDEGTWHVVWRGNAVSAENDPGGSNPGWLSTFILDYAQTPSAVLNNNATDWSSDPNARGYVDADDASTDLASEDPGYFVIRCRHGSNVYDVDKYRPSRARVTLTLAGDETVAGKRIYGNDTADAGGGRAVISQNVSTNRFIWINYCFDDNSDGYRITDDGTITWDIVIEEKY